VAGDQASEHDTERLARGALFEAIPATEREQLLARGQVVAHPAGAVLMQEGEQSDTVFVFLEGEAVIEAEGQEVGLPVRPGDCVGELAALDGSPRSATVTATTPGRALVMSGPEFEAALGELPHLRQQLTRTLARKLRHVSDGWAGLAADTELLLDALLSLQESPEPTSRREAARRAADLLVRAAATDPRAESPDDEASSARLAELTPAERRVAALVAEGLSNAAIAEELYVSRHTVDSHLKHIFVKLGITSRVTLATMVLRDA
jgi:CRP-like cAMP-binding protein